MNQQTIEVMHQCSQRSLDGTMAFPEVVRRLAETGVEFYHADLMRQEKTYYLPSGESHVEPLPLPTAVIDAIFSGNSVRAAVKSIQHGEIDYPEFLKRIMQAGTVYYCVFIQGRNTIYVGRKGDSYTEHFPSIT